MLQSYSEPAHKENSRIEWQRMLYDKDAFNAWVIELQAWKALNQTNLTLKFVTQSELEKYSHCWTQVQTDSLARAESLPAVSRVDSIFADVPCPPHLIEFPTHSAHHSAFILCRAFNYLPVNKGFPGGSVVKNPLANAGDISSIPRSRRSPGEGNSNLLQYSCLTNPMDRGAQWATVHGVAKSQTQLSD